MQNELPLSPSLSVSIRLGGDVGVADPHAAAAGGPVEGAGLPDGPPAAEPAFCCPQAAVRADTPMTAAARNETLRMRTSESHRVSHSGRRRRSGPVRPRGLDAPLPGYVPAKIGTGYAIRPDGRAKTTIMSFRYASATVTAHRRRPSLPRDAARPAARRPRDHEGKSMSFGTRARNWSARGGAAAIALLTVTAGTQAAATAAQASRAAQAGTASA